MMLRITLDKLRPIIEILEDQLVEKEHKKKHTRMEWLLPTDPYKPVRKPSSSGSSSDCEKDFFKLKQMKEELDKDSVYKKRNPIIK